MDKKYIELDDFLFVGQKVITKNFGFSQKIEDIKVVKDLSKTIITKKTMYFVGGLWQTEEEVLKNYYFIDD